MVWKLKDDTPREAGVSKLALREAKKKVTLQNEGVLKKQLLIHSVGSRTQNGTGN